MPHFNSNSEGRPEVTPVAQAQSSFREAGRIQNKADSFEARRERVGQACSKKFSDNNNGDGPYDGMTRYAYVEKTFKDSVVFSKAGKLYKATYTDDDGEITFGDPKEVDDAYVERKVSEAASPRRKKTKMNPAKVIGNGGYKKEPIHKGYTGQIAKRIVP